MKSLVKAVMLTLCGLPGALLTLIGLNFLIVGSEGPIESPRWVAYVIGVIALSLAALFFTLLWATLRSAFIWATVVTKRNDDTPKRS